MTVGELKYFIEGMGLVDSTPSLAQWKNLVSKVEEVHTKDLSKLLTLPNRVAATPPFHPGGMTTYL